MGLLLQTETSYGLDITYWHIARVTHNFEGKTSSVMLNGFLTQDARMAGANAIVSRGMEFSGDDFDPEATRATMYEKIKLLPDFIGATDD